MDNNYNLDTDIHVINKFAPDVSSLIITKKLNNNLSVSNKNIKDSHDYHHIESIKNKLDDETQGLIQTQQSSLQNSIMNVEAKMVSSVLMRLFRANNAFGDEANLFSKDEEESFRKELAIILATYYGIIIPLFGKNVLSRRAQEFGQFTKFKFENNIKK